MAHIAIEEGIPGILGPMKFRPETTKPLRELAEVSASSMRTVSLRPNARPLQRSSRPVMTAASASSLIAPPRPSIWAEMRSTTRSSDAVKADFLSASISPKLKALLAIAGKVQQGGKHVTPQDIAAARAQNASDREIHDTVLIAAMFCMFNRYVDGLATWQPEDPAEYREMGKLMAHSGYTRTQWETSGELR